MAPFSITFSRFKWSEFTDVCQPFLLVFPRSTCPIWEITFPGKTRGTASSTTTFCCYCNLPEFNKRPTAPSSGDVSSHIVLIFLHRLRQNPTQALSTRQLPRSVFRRVNLLSPPWQISVSPARIVVPTALYSTAASPLLFPHSLASTAVTLSRCVAIKHISEKDHFVKLYLLGLLSPVVLNLIGPFSLLNAHILSKPTIPAAAVPTFFTSKSTNALPRLFQLRTLISLAPPYEGKI